MQEQKSSLTRRKSCRKRRLSPSCQYTSAQGMDSPRGLPSAGRCTYRLSTPDAWPSDALLHDALPISCRSLRALPLAGMEQRATCSLGAEMSDELAVESLLTTDENLLWISRTLFTMLQAASSWCMHRGSNRPRLYLCPRQPPSWPFACKPNASVGSRDAAGDGEACVPATETICAWNSRCL